MPLPVPEPLVSRVQSVTITETDSERSAFSIVLDAGRSGPLAALDSPLVADPTFAMGARVVLMVTLGAVPTVLMDGIVTGSELTPGDGRKPATMEVKGEDVSYLLDQEEKDAEYPALNDYLQVLAILGPYAAQGILPMAIPPTTLDQPTRGSGTSERKTLNTFSQRISPVFASAQTTFSASYGVCGLWRQRV